MSKKIFFLTAAFLLTLIFFNQPGLAREEFNQQSCSFGKIKLSGRVQIVENFPDLTVQVVDNFPDLKVQLVSSFPRECGEWQIVANFPDLKVKFVENFGDVKIEFVENFPGIP